MGWRIFPLGNRYWSNQFCILKNSRISEGFHVVSRDLLQARSELESAVNFLSLIESKRDGRYFYWILIGEKFLLIHASLQSKLKRMETITNATFIPSRPYDQAPNA